ncbi:hypothetical protein [Salinactinospora qingdaonensis]|uniref:Uncharacterized protein n=1 Tax=Salinactinospora qingdaonensis TaxID=702744 RepID=A0ABP7FGN8_9ACTN
MSDPPRQLTSAELARLVEPGAIRVEVTPDATTVILHLGPREPLVFTPNGANAKDATDIARKLAAAGHYLSVLLSSPAERQRAAEGLANAHWMKPQR